MVLKVKILNDGFSLVDGVKKQLRTDSRKK